VPSLPTGTVTFLFTDIEGSTTLLQRLGDRYAQILADQRRLLRAAFQSLGGHEVSAEGDASFVAFPRAKDAVEAAVAAQKAIASHAWPEGAQVRVRMGLHTGEPLSTDMGYIGMDVHQASRICSAGHGGQILISDATQALVANDLPEGVSLRDLGEHRLKDLAHRHRLFQVTAADLPADFPPLKSLNVLPNNLPLQLTSFIGRRREIVEINTTLATARLLTLTGAGGSGKTRLALQVGADLLEQYPDGVWLVELATLADPALVPQTVATALRVHEQPGRALIETLVDSLRPKTLLLLLDNCEHLLAACAGLAHALLRTCPNLRILATSREGLGIAGETLYPVPTLPFPNPELLPSMEHLVQYESVRLFTERAMVVLATFNITPQNAKSVALICSQLDGIPLAIELAAVRVKTLAVAQILSRLGDRFRLLTGGTRSAPLRHQTLQAAMDWSYDLLREKERAVLRRLAVFAGGCTLETAEAVCAGNGIETSEILDLLTQLVDKSLVIVDAQHGEARYRLLETVRQYGKGKLVEAGEDIEMQRQHRTLFLALAEQAEPHLRSTDEAAWLERLEVEHDNFRAALEWALNDGEARLRLAGVLGRFWDVRGYLSEGRRRLEGALSGSDTASSARAKALHWAGMLAMDQGDDARARALLEDSVAIYRELRETPGMALSLRTLGYVAYYQNDYSRAVELAEDSLVHSREHGDTLEIASSLDLLGRLAWRRGDYKQAQSLSRECLALCRKIGHQGSIGTALNLCGIVACYQGDFAGATAFIEEKLALDKELRWRAPSTVAILGFVAYCQGDYARATKLLEQGLDLSRELGHKRVTAIALGHLGMVAFAQSNYSRASDFLRQSLPRLGELGEKWFVASFLEALGKAEYREERPARAAKLFGAAEALRDSIGAPVPPIERTGLDRYVAALGKALSAAEFNVAWAWGRSMTLEQAIEFGLGEAEP
jgi:predicted ATPase/class 3 adenylate cyclase